MSWRFAVAAALSLMACRAASGGHGAAKLTSEEVEARLSRCEEALPVYQEAALELLGDSWPDPDDDDAGINTTWASVLAQLEGNYLPPDAILPTEDLVRSLAPTSELRRGSAMDVNAALDWSLPLHRVSFDEKSCSGESAIVLERASRYWTPLGNVDPRETCLGVGTEDALWDVTAVVKILPQLSSYLGFVLSDDGRTFRMPMPQVLVQRFNAIAEAPVRFYGQGSGDPNAMRQRYYYRVMRGADNASDTPSERIWLPFADTPGFLYAHDISAHMLSFLIPEAIWRGIRESATVLNVLHTLATTRPVSYRGALQVAAPGMRESERELWLVALEDALREQVARRPRWIDAGTGNALGSGILKILNEGHLDFDSAPGAFRATVEQLAYAYGTETELPMQLGHHTSAPRAVPVQWTGKGIVYRAFSMARDNALFELEPLSDAQIDAAVDAIASQFPLQAETETGKKGSPLLNSLAYTDLGHAFSGTNLLSDKGAFLEALLAQRAKVEAWSLPGETRR